MSKRPSNHDDPAFPCVVPDEHATAVFQEGLSTRELYAGLALSRLAGQFADNLDTGLTGAQRCAAACAAHADALLAELVKPKE